MELSDAMDRVGELQKMIYDMLDYLRIQIAWLLEYCEKYNIPLEDIEKAKLFFRKPGEILEKYLPTESQQRNKTTDDSTEQDMLMSQICNSYPNSFNQLVSHDISCKK
jgi:hypothetical protein